MTPRVRAGAIAAATALAGFAAGCPTPPSRPAQAAPDRSLGDEDSRLAHAYSELADDIFTAYDRDEPPEPATGVVDARIGPARIGAGPGDFYVGGAVAHAPSRWPLDVDHSVRTEVRSKRLEIQLALDQSAAWMSDEVSWRMEQCGKTAVIPLRITALYAQDGDRWVLIVEHVSFGWTPSPTDDVPLRDPIKPQVASGGLRDQLASVLARGLFGSPHDPAVAAQTGGALVLGPGMADEWHGARVLDAQLPTGVLEDARVGLIGRDADTATVAYWIGTYAAGAAAPQRTDAHKVRLRVTHIFEKRWFASPDGLPTEGKSCGIDGGVLRDTTRRRDIAEHCHWMLIQSHMSLPIEDGQLAHRVFGHALVSPKPLKLDCEAPAKAPAVEPRSAVGPPAGQSP